MKKLIVSALLSSRLMAMWFSRESATNRGEVDPREYDSYEAFREAWLNKNGSNQNCSKEFSCSNCKCKNK
tara:strand:+ start:1898 stop:2107 length:210 start_codon:yes stop_codon:yes gene_type:complete